MHRLWLVWICNFITVVAANGTGGEKNVMVQDPNEMTTANGIISLSVVATSGEKTVDNPVEITATEQQPINVQAAAAVALGNVALPSRIWKPGEKPRNFNYLIYFY